MTNRRKQRAAIGEAVARAIRETTKKTTAETAGQAHKVAPGEFRLEVNLGSSFEGSSEEVGMWVR